MKPDPGSGESRSGRSLFGRIRGRISAWPRGLVVVGLSLTGVIAIAASVAMYRAYAFIQHDNEFCNSCHLMADAFARFNQSEHRGLGCKACHRPNIIQRASMGLIAIIENPTEVGPHAPVSNERCGECHVKGNPEEWKLISSSVGHRVHLESTDPALQGLRCITCHATSIHEFAAINQTCAQSGCHEQSRVQLGKMSNLEIHCAACHDFSRPVATAVDGDSLKNRLLPRRPECLSCHAMRERVRQMPETEPHGNVCGTCHNPHEQTSPELAVTTCASGTCHERIDTVSPFHRGLDTGVLEKCTSCHGAHDWKVKSTECQACHSPESLDNGIRRIAPSPHQTVGTMSAGSFDLVLLPYRLFAAVLQQQLKWPAPPSDAAGRFSHRLHRTVTCTACHTAEDAHGTIKIRTATDCAGCHHSKANQQRCTSCHGREELGGVRERTLPVKLSVWATARSRTLTFAHNHHAGIGCVSCHQGAPSFSALKSCDGCHRDHHDVERACASCHNLPVEAKAHDRRVHLTCEGAECHTSALLPRPVTARGVCIACHTQQVDHEPGGDCASCHLIPKRRVSTAEREP